MLVSVFVWVLMMGDVSRMRIVSARAKRRLSCRVAKMVVLLVSKSLVSLKGMLELESGLDFTTELNVNNRLPFLDLLVNATDGDFETSVYVKPTNLGRCTLRPQPGAFVI